MAAAPVDELAQAVWEVAVGLERVGREVEARAARHAFGESFFQSNTYIYFRYLYILDSFNICVCVYLCLFARIYTHSHKNQSECHTWGQIRPL